MKYSTLTKATLPIFVIESCVHRATEHSVHPTCGSLRDLQAFFWLRVFPASKQSPHPPTTNAHHWHAYVGTKETLMQIFIIVVASFSTFLILYLAFLRPWQLRWGSTNMEIERPMPGDDIVEKPSFNANRAVTINAPAQNIYPWIVQMGVNRAGWYSYDLLDNLGKRSAETILLEHQNIKKDDLIPMSPDGKQGLYVKDFRNNEWILWWDKVGDSTWTWGIYPDGNSRTRLVTRVRVKYKWLSFVILFNLIIEFFDIIMMRKCILEIQRRAETITSTQIPAG